MQEVWISQARTSEIATYQEGASLLDAKVSGVYFPDELSPEEIRLSLDHGTRLRYNK